MEDPRYSLSAVSGERAALSASGVPTWIGRYRVLKALGAGGMADVYLALSTFLSFEGRVLVLKRVRPELEAQVAGGSTPPEGGDPHAMLLEEARSAVALCHPNIVRTYDCEDIDGQLVLSMGYLEGLSLYQLVRIVKAGERPFPWRLAIHIAKELLSGLASAHVAGVIHRDVSPQNVIVTYDGEVKIIDFGIAKNVANPHQTAVGTIKGKLGYMAPEQVRGGPVDARVDVFAAGVVLWELLAGRRLRPAGQAMASMLAGILTSSPTPLRAARPEMPRRLEELVMRALATRTEDRFASALDMRAALDAYEAQTRARATAEQLARFVRECAGTHRDALRAEVAALYRAALVELRALRSAPQSSPRVTPTSPAAVAADTTSREIDLALLGVPVKRRRFVRALVIACAAFALAFAATFALASARGTGVILTP